MILWTKTVPKGINNKALTPPRADRSDPVSANAGSLVVMQWMEDLQGLRSQAVATGLLLSAQVTRSLTGTERGYSSDI